MRESPRRSPSSKGLILGASRSELHNVTGNLPENPWAVFYSRHLMADRELQQRLQDFVEYRLEHLDDDEKGEAQLFLDHLFQAFGHEGTRQAGARHETRIRKRDTRRVSFADLVWERRLLLEMKKTGEQLGRHYQQAFEYWLNLTPARTDYVVLCNFDELWIYDLNRQLEEPVDRVEISDLPQRWESLAFMLPEPLEPVPK